MRIVVQDKDSDAQKVEISRSIDDICAHHIDGTSRSKPLPTYIKQDSNPCYGCIDDEFNAKCPGYMPASRIHVFEILENE